MEKNKIDAYKKAHGKVLLYTFDDKKEIYFKEPSFLEIRASIRTIKEKTQTDFKEVCVTSVILGGDFDKKTILAEENEPYFNGFFEDVCVDLYSPYEVEETIEGEAGLTLKINGEEFKLNPPTRAITRKAEADGADAQVLGVQEFLLKECQNENYLSLKKQAPKLFYSLLVAIKGLEKKKKGSLSTL